MKHRNLQQYLLGLILFCTAFISIAANQLTGLKVKPLHDKQTIVLLTFSQTLNKTPSVFAMKNPDRVIVDLKNTLNGLHDQKTIDHSNLLSNVNVISDTTRTRVVFDLREPSHYKISISGKTARLVFYRDMNVTQSLKHTNTLTKVDFKHGEQKGSGKLILNLRDNNIHSKLRRDGNKLFVTLSSTRLAKGLAKKYDVADYRSPAKTLAIAAKGRDTQLIINTQGKYEEAAFQLNKQFIVELIPAQANTAKDGTYHGKRVSLNFQKIPVRQVLQVLAEFTDSNLIVSNAVQGDISLRLDEVPWDQALAIILKTQGLTQRKEGNIIMIAPTQELLAQSKNQLQADEEMRNLAPLKSESFHIKYGKANAYYDTLKEADNTLLSPRGKIILNKRTNMLFVQDTPEKLRGIRHYIQKTDVAVKQVEIEARIVTVDKSFEREIGIKWNVNQSSLSNPADANNPGLRGFNLDLGAQKIGNTAPGSIALATLSNDVLIGMELSALEAEGLGEILSSPRLLTADQQEAVIEQGTEIPYQETTSSGAAAVAFKKALLRLKVVPQITPDNKVLLKLEVNQDAKSKETIGDQIPIIDTRHITTNVLVNNGETVVLGGIYERTKSNNVSRVPFISSIPVLGELFKHRSIVDSRKELLIFVTPRIVNNQSD